MRRIEIHEPRPLAETLRYTALRVAVGGLIAFHGGQGLQRVGWSSALFDGQSWQPVPGWQVSVPVVLFIVAELVAGTGLALGLFTRTSAVAAACLTAIAVMTTQAEYPSLLRSWEQYEADCLLFVLCLYVAAAGGGDFSADHRMRERARRLAIQRDEIWSRPPYVSLHE
jgi:uncharacterized membrane protein YphA (DoxX/SURF4 family)